MSAKPFLEAKKIRMVFPGTLALDDIDFSINAGEVHAIVGENGAGKSTFMKIISGVYKMTAGQLYIDAEPVNIQSVSDAQKYGISMIYQELSNFPKLSVAENIFMGRQEKNKLGIVSFKHMYKATKSLLDKFDIGIRPQTLLSKLSVAEKQFVEIIKAVSAYNPRVVIMDEPTSSLTKHEIDKLFAIIRKLKENGVCIVYISHRMDEIFELADRITVFRDGKNVGCMERSQYDEKKIISLMLGHSIKEFEKNDLERSEVIFEIKELSIVNKIENFSMQLHKGEILGIAGLMGSGKDELIKSLFGLWPSKAKRIYYKGKQIVLKNPKDALKLGIVYLPEERKTQALFLEMSVKLNILVTWLMKSKKDDADNQSEKSLAEKMIQKLNIKTTSSLSSIATLSGGNQQKAVIARLLAIRPEIMILNDPTRGIDVGSKDEIYRMIRDLASKGTSIVVVSSELEEICHICDRAIVLSKGEVCGELSDKEVTMGNILPCAVRIGNYE